MEEKERYIIDRFDEDIFDTKKEYYPSNQTICEIINKQDKRIKELKEENQQLIKALNGEVFINYKLPMENAQLKQQLHDLPKKIVEEIKLQLFNHFKVKNIEEYEKLPLIDSLFTADTVIEILDTILKSMEGKMSKEKIITKK